MKKLVVFFALFLVIFLVAFSYVPPEPKLICNFRDLHCNGDETYFFDVYSNNNLIINSKVLLNTSIDYANLLKYYNKTFCCKISGISIGGIHSIIVRSNENCPLRAVEFFYVSNDSDARISVLAVPNIYKYKICLKTDGDYVDTDMRVTDINLSSNGYVCLFKLSKNISGKISQCNLDPPYDYLVWGKVLRNPNNLKCMEDCSSKIDGRIYLSCRNVFERCKNVPPMCDGVLKGSWVNYDNYRDVKCEAPWNIFRSKTFTESRLQVDSVSDECQNLVYKSYPVIYNNQQINLRVYTCND